MRWTELEIDKAIKLLKNGNNLEKIGVELKRTKKAIKEKLSEFGYKQSDFIKIEYHHSKICLQCNKNFISLISEDRKFCSQSCSAKFNNKLNPKKIKIITVDDKTKKIKNKIDSICLNCGEVINYPYRYCNNSCSSEHKLKLKFKKIESGDTTISFKIYKKYLIVKFGNKCMECGWCEVNPVTGNVPIQLEHIDGNSDNNSLDNIKLLCPNCHSLTPTYGALNKGNGRDSLRNTKRKEWRESNKLESNS
jgi:hypothetical protein